MPLTITISLASAGIGGIFTYLGRLGIQARRQWSRQRAAAVCGTCGKAGQGCGGGACSEWM